MPVDERWGKVTPSDWNSFAKAWIAVLHNVPPDGNSKVAESVVQMNFTAAPELLWQFIQMAVDYAESDNDLSHIAAGPLEHLLGWHGDQYIAIVEKYAESNLKFARMMTGVWRYLMTDEVWQRVQAIQAKVSVPLKLGNVNP